MARDPLYGEDETGETDGNMKLMAELVMRLLNARTIAHTQHLGTRSYAIHMALNEFYNDIGENADEIAEKWQGAYQQLLVFPDPMPLEKDPLAFLKELRQWIESNRGEACDDSEIQNLIDEAMATIDGAMYKINFLH
jgi:hypothetical protein